MEVSPRSLGWMQQARGRAGNRRQAFRQQRPLGTATCSTAVTSAVRLACRPVLHVATASAGAKKKQANDLVPVSKSNLALPSLPSWLVAERRNVVV